MFCFDGVCIGHATGSINISNILTGKCLAKIRATNSFPTDRCACSGGCSGRNCSSKKRRIQASTSRSSVAEALEDITALFYDEERNEIYTGNRHGLVHVWSNWRFHLVLLGIICSILLPDRWIHLADGSITTWSCTTRRCCFTPPSSFFLWFLMH